MKHFLTIQNKFKLYFNGRFFIYSDAGTSAIETERKDETLCHSDSNRTLSCPDEHFIDMFPGGEHPPQAVAILDFSCPEASDRQSVLSNIHTGCQREAIDLLMRQVSNNMHAHILNLWKMLEYHIILFKLIKIYERSCHGEKECSLDPSSAQLDLTNTICPFTTTNFIFFSYRCFYSK